MPKGLNPNKRPLRNLTVEQASGLLKENDNSVPLVAKQLGVTPQALNRWLRINKCKRTITLVCEESASK